MSLLLLSRPSSTTTKTANGIQIKQSDCIVVSFVVVVVALVVVVVVGIVVVVAMVVVVVLDFFVVAIVVDVDVPVVVLHNQSIIFVTLTFPQSIKLWNSLPYNLNCIQEFLHSRAKLLEAWLALTIG